MGLATNNTGLTDARVLKDDEFYTPYDYAAKELAQYDWSGRRVLCPCNDAGRAFDVWFTSHGVQHVCPPGDYAQAIGLPLMPSPYDFDVIVTNPPFSQSARFIRCVIDSGKQFLFICSRLILGHQTAFPLWRAGRLWSGFNHQQGGVFYGRPDGSQKEVAGAWYTNLPVPPTPPLHTGMTCERLRQLGRWQAYDAAPDVLFLSDVLDYPDDWPGPTAVPVNSFWRFSHQYYQPLCTGSAYGDTVNGRVMFSRLVVQRRK